MTADRSKWIDIGRVKVNPDNALAVGIALAGERAFQSQIESAVISSGRASDEREAVYAAVDKRARRQEKRRRQLVNQSWGEV